MKDLSLFLLKNSFGFKMRKGFNNFCNSENSTSTLDHQQKIDRHRLNNNVSPCITAKEAAPARESHPTLEDMILQLEVEEKMSSRARLEDYMGIPHRMSCVNSSDILRSARNALNQYPRFSLDGKDSLYRSSFTDIRPRKLIVNHHDYDAEAEKARKFPNVVAGESVIWCKPGVVAKLMGLEAIPVPMNSSYYRRQKLSAIVKRQNLRRRSERNEMERRRLMSENRRGMVGSCSRTGYCVMKPLDFEISNDEAGWPMRRFV